MRKPIIGITGGIGSGKSFVAGLFGELGCLVVNSDEQVSRAYERDDVRQTLRSWWGTEVFKPEGAIDRRAIAARVFADPAERKRLEGLLHPLVTTMRDEAMSRAADDPQVVAYVWDTPLLFETLLSRQCDALVYVDAPLPARLERVARQRGWDEAELIRREKSQLPLDNKREMSDYMVSNAAGADQVRIQVRDVLSLVLAEWNEKVRKDACPAEQPKHPPR